MKSNSNPQVEEPGRQRPGNHSTEKSPHTKSRTRPYRRSHSEFGSNEKTDGCSSIDDLTKDLISDEINFTESTTYGTLIKEFVLKLAEGSPKKVRYYEMLNRLHVEPVIGHLKLNQVHLNHILTILRALRANGYSNGTINRVLTEVRRVFKLAQKHKIVGHDHDPTMGILFAVEVPKERFLDEEEVKRLHLSLCEECDSVVSKAIWLLLLTGARRNEVIELLWKDVDLRNGFFNVPIAKSQKKRVVTLNVAAVEVLRSIERVPGNPYVFPWPKTGKPMKTLNYHWDRLRRRAGLQGLRLHDLRHSFASFLVKRNVSLYTVQRLLGHASIKTTERYAHLDQRTLRCATDFAFSFVQSPSANTSEHTHGVCDEEDFDMFQTNVSFQETLFNLTAH